MNLFLSDGVHHRGETARALSAALQADVPHVFAEGDYTAIERHLPEADCLLLHLISEHKGFGHAGEAEEAVVRRYVEAGKPILLFHASSAAFVRWPWWRSLPGLRWVRNDDPDGLSKSRHLHDPYDVDPVAPRSLTAPALLPMQELHDELYIDLYPEGPVELWMTCTHAGITHPQVFVSRTPFGGAILSFLPGHRPQTVTRPDYLANATSCICWLLSPSAGDTHAH